MKKTNVPGSQSFGQKLLQFIRNNTPELMLTAAGVEAHQVKVTILIIGNVAFMADGSGDVVVKGVK